MGRVSHEGARRARRARALAVRRAAATAAGLLVVGVMGTAIGALSTTGAVAGASPAATVGPPLQQPPAPPNPVSPPAPTWGNQPQASGSAAPLLQAQPPQLANPFETLTVDTTSDTTPSTDAAAAQAACATGNSSTCSLRAAIEVADFYGLANDNPANDEVIAINVPGGTYALSNGPLEVTDPNGVIITGGVGGSGGTLVTQTSGSTDRVIDVATCALLNSNDPLHCASGSPANVSISGLTVSGGNPSNDTSLGASGTGGGIYVGFGDLLQMNGVTVSGNSANGGSGYGFGGGIFVEGGDLWLADSSIEGNTAAANGGGIFAVDGAGVALTDTTLSNNTAGSESYSYCYAGGGIATFNASLLIAGGAITGNQVLSGYMSEGGGIYNDGTTSLGGVTISGNKVTASGAPVGAPAIPGESVAQAKNYRDPAYGGGVYDEAGLTTVEGSTVSGNVASNTNPSGGAQGGGFFINSGSPLISDSTISENQATTPDSNGGEADGGGIAVYGASVTLSYVELTGNTASSAANYAGGGGIYFMCTDGNLLVDVSTVSGNTASAGGTDYWAYGGGIYDQTYGGGVTVVYSQVDSNTATAATAGDSQGGGAFDTAPTVNYTGDVIWGNVAASGGGLAQSGWNLEQLEAVSISNTSVAGNKASEGVGGGIQDERVQAQVSGSTIEYNSANRGAGVALDVSQFDASSTAIVDNTASGTGNAGGGLYVAAIVSAPMQAPDQSSPQALGFRSLDLYAVTISGNVSDEGAGIYSGIAGSAGSIGTTTIAGNLTSSGTEQDCAFSGSSGSFVSAGGNVTQDNTCGLDGTSDLVGLARQGYWLAGSDGGVFAINTTFYGSLPGLGISVNNVVGMAKAPGNEGYWLVGSNGGVYAFGSAHFYGSLPGLGISVNDIVGIVSTPDGGGYWLIGADGGVFAFGDAPFYGSMGGHPLNKPIVGGAATPDGEGYWLVASDGGIFSFGDAGYFGSAGGSTLSQPVVAMTPTTDGNGYWLVGADGGVFNYGDAPFEQALPGIGVSTTSIKTILGTPDAGGYWEADRAGNEYAFGNAPFITTLAALGKHVKNIVGGAGTTQA